MSTRRVAMYLTWYLISEERSWTISLAEETDASHFPTPKKGCQNESYFHLCPRIYDFSSLDSILRDSPCYHSVLPLSPSSPNSERGIPSAATLAHTVCENISWACILRIDFAPPWK